MSPIIEAVTVVRWRAANVPKGWRRRGLRGVKRLAYRDAAWAKIRARCKCVHHGDEGSPAFVCRYHDKEYRAEDIPDSYEGPGWHGFIAPLEWGLPRREEPGFWDYGRAVAFRLARFYRHCDSRIPTPQSVGSERRTAEAREQGRADGLDEAAAILAGMWDDGEQGPPRAQIEQYAEIVLLRSRAEKVRAATLLAASRDSTPSQPEAMPADATAPDDPRRHAKSDSEPTPIPGRLP